jgi:hypothetical protein
MTHWYWSGPLAGFGLIGLYLAGRKSYWGWVVGLADEVLWIIYAVHTGQWSFCVSALAYAWVYGRNLRAWVLACRVDAQGASPRKQHVPRPAGPPSGGGRGRTGVAAGSVHGVSGQPGARHPVRAFAGFGRGHS